jgi:hypothetical protein
VPRFYFNIEDGKKIEDHEGTELPDVAAARTESIALAGALLKDAARYWDGTDWRMTVTDDTGVVVFMLRFSAEECDPAAQASASASPRPSGPH